MNITWQCNHFDALTTLQLHDIFQARQSVFIVEQHCAYPDIDYLDINAWHVIGLDMNTVAGYARILPPGLKYPEASIGRILTTSPYRGHSIGKLLLTYAIAETERLFNGMPIKIGAQEYLKRFYERFGFKDLNQPFLEDGMPHLLMLKS